MCDTCGCGEGSDKVLIRRPGGNGHAHAHDHAHSHDHDHACGHGHAQDHSHGDAHSHDHGHVHDHVHGDDRGHAPDHPHTHDQPAGRRRIVLEDDIMASNNLAASRNAGFFEAKKIVAINLMSSPGSGKTTLLERTIRMLESRRKVAVIEGDQQTLNDAERIQETGAPVVQVNTGKGCHLDAEMIHRAVRELQPEEGSVLFIENVGNLVCPSLFELGEQKRVVIVSVTEGEDKPQKYPTIFRSADLCILNKTDLLPHVDFDQERFRSFAMEVNPGLEFLALSAKTGEGMDRWIDWTATLRNG